MMALGLERDPTAMPAIRGNRTIGGGPTIYLLSRPHNEVEGRK